MANLRDQGYPASARMINAPFKNRTARTVEGTGDVYKRDIPYGSDEWVQALPRVDVDPLLSDDQEAYVNALNKVLGAVSPLSISHSSNLVSPDYNWGAYVDTMNSLNSPDDTRLAYAHSVKNQNPAEPDYYGAGIDNLNAILGDNDFYKEYDLPLGITAEAEYDGDTLAGGLNIPSKEYYVAALMNLLKKR